MTYSALNAETRLRKELRGEIVGLPGPKGDQGPVFTPKLSGAGDLSWSNNGGLPNPEPVNLQKKAQLTNAQREALNALAVEYQKNRGSFVYHYTSGPDIYAAANTAYQTIDGEPRAKVNCALFCMLVWAGISPSKFLDPASYTPAFSSADKAFNWGWKPKFDLRANAYGLIKNIDKLDPEVGITEDNFYGFVKPYADSYRGSYSWISGYSPTASNAFEVTIEGVTKKYPNRAKQMLKAFYHGSDLAQELYYMGCEVPVSEVQRGDLMFFTAPVEADQAPSSKIAFREIVHCAFVHAVDAKTGTIQLLESIDSGDYPINYSSMSFSGVYNKTWGASTLSRCVMVARHPAAFGITTNVGDGFTVWPTPEGAIVPVDWPGEVPEDKGLPEEQRHKVQTISSSATHDQYPSAKAVRDAITAKTAVGFTPASGATGRTITLDGSSQGFVLKPGFGLVSAALCIKVVITSDGEVAAGEELQLGTVPASYAPPGCSVAVAVSMKTTNARRFMGMIDTAGALTVRASTSMPAGTYYLYISGSYLL